MTKRKQHKPEFKARVALEALKGEQTVTKPASRYEVHSTIIHQWKKPLLDGASEIYQRGRNPEELEGDTGRLKDLHAKIGELMVEQDFLEQLLRLLLGRNARRRSGPAVPTCQSSGNAGWSRSAGRASIACREAKRRRTSP